MSTSDPRHYDVILSPVITEKATMGDDIHLDQCWSTDSLRVNTIFHRNTECWSS
jgi:ribosomal protein L23